MAPSSNPIQPGDLVMVVRSCCARFAAKCPIFVVASIDEEGKNGYGCVSCGQPLPLAAWATDGQDPGNVVPLPWLRKFKPLEEPEEITTIKEIERHVDLTSPR